MIAAKTAKPHPKLPGTIYSAAEEGIVLSVKSLNRICSQGQKKIRVFVTTFKHFLQVIRKCLLTPNIAIIIKIVYSVSTNSIFTRTSRVFSLDIYSVSALNKVSL